MTGGVLDMSARERSGREQEHRHRHIEAFEFSHALLVQQVRQVDGRSVT